jgi:hypothetical protein
MAPERKMASRTRKQDHIDSEAILGLAEGAQPSAASRTHLERCAVCREHLQRAERLVQDLRAGGIVDPPPATLARAIALYPRRPPLAERVREAVARLVHGADSVALAAAGLRGETSAPARLLFQGLGVEVDVELSPEAGSFQVSGMVLAHSAELKPLTAWAEIEGRQLGETAVSDLGTFVLEGVPAGRFDLVVDFGSSRLRLPVAAEAAA